MALFTKAISATSSTTKAVTKRAGRINTGSASHAGVIAKQGRVTRARTVTTSMILTGGGITYRPGFLVFYYEDQEEQGPPMPGLGNEDFTMTFAYENITPVFQDETYRPTIRRD